MISLTLVQGDVVNYSCFFNKSGMVLIDETIQSDNCCNRKRMEKLYKQNGVGKSHFTATENQQCEQKICKK